MVNSFWTKKGSLAKQVNLFYGHQVGLAYPARGSTSPVVGTWVTCRWTTHGMAVPEVSVRQLKRRRRSTKMWWPWKRLAVLQWRWNVCLTRWPRPRSFPSQKTKKTCSAYEGTGHLTHSRTLLLEALDCVCFDMLHVFPFRSAFHWWNPSTSKTWGVLIEASTWSTEIFHGPYEEISKRTKMLVISMGSGSKCDGQFIFSEDGSAVGGRVDDAVFRVDVLGRACVMDIF